MTSGRLLHNMGFHQCEYLCLQSVNCAAFNHNATDDECTLLRNPCPLAQRDPEMVYSIFSETPVHQCPRWIPYTSGDDIDDRMIASQTGAQMVSRIMYNGNYLIGYEFIRARRCFTYNTVADQVVASGSSAPCERLRIADDCTAFWIPYTAGDPLPEKAVTGGRMASGDAAYVVKFDVVYNSKAVIVSGYYTEEAGYAVTTYFGLRSSSTMMMLLTL